MTTIDELEEMDFVNWDAAAPVAGLTPPTTSEGAPNVGMSLAESNMDLVLENVDGDDWSFWALQHFDATHNPQDASVMTEDFLQQQPEDMAIDDQLTTELYWENPETPCLNCAAGGFQCKRIREGKYKGYCTSCVALRCECSFGPSPSALAGDIGATFPANPWPTIGDRPETSILHEDDLAAIMDIASTAAPGMSCLPALAEDLDVAAPKPQYMPKIGARFSRESVKVLRNWVSTHSRHPYPTEEEKENLQKMTGLNKTQITNWLANARRRGKIQPTRSTSPHVGRGYGVQAIDIPQRRGTPGLLESMNPLQRWANSPPENEPASVTAIARAVTASSSATSSNSGLNSPFLSGYSDDGSSRSLCNQSSASSLGTSQSSNGSFASAYSHQSRGSFGSIPSFARNRGRRRRRRAPPKRSDEQLRQPLKTFQCTFCTETFRTKHDWQRHEKSLHLSLERWVCCTEGPKTVNPENGILSCVFCGERNPDETHIESHNYSSCTERNLEERTFYRKDHLRQHLKLVHNVKFLAWSMDPWRVTSPQIRSRCGFCGIVMDSWSSRVDHLAEHFKTGNTMAEWKGDWGFDAPVLEMVENSIPPYLIHDERMSPLPYQASQNAPATPHTAYELLKNEIQYWTSYWEDENGRPPTDDELQYEACRIILAAEVQAPQREQEFSSWLRDLIMGKDEVCKRAMLSPVRKSAENKSNLRINGKTSPFENDILEKQLQDFVAARDQLGLTAMDPELQTEACRIIGRAEETSTYPSEQFANWVLRLITSSATWLANFRKRACLPHSEDIGDISQRSKNPRTIDSTIHNYSRLERDLGEYLQIQRSIGLEPSDADLQRQARIIIYDADDSWNQTAADDSEWLSQFRERHVVHSATQSASSNDSPSNFLATELGVASQQIMRDSQYVGDLPSATSNTTFSPLNNARPARAITAGPFFLNDANCYRRLAKGLRRFVAQTMSPNNPNRHVPTDEELQHQARWFVFDDDDPWNQTAADNAEWLIRFKRDVGILPVESGPGLLTSEVQWAASAGGTGFAPPFVHPNPDAVIEPLQELPQMYCTDGIKPFEGDTAAANHYLQNLASRYPAPAKVFCSRELENGLIEFAKQVTRETGSLPTDDALKAKAREIIRLPKTPCDDPLLVAKFRGMMEAMVSPSSSAAAAAPITTSLDTPLLPLDVDVHISNEDVNEILQMQDIAFDPSLEALANPLNRHCG